jgi:hypothetical protein
MTVLPDLTVALVGTNVKHINLLPVASIKLKLLTLDRWDGRGIRGSMRGISIVD